MSQRQSLLSLSLCLLAGTFGFPAFVVAQDHPDRPPSASRSRTNQGGPSGAEKELFDAANRERAAEDLPALEWDPALANAARKHVLRMAEEKLLEHQYAGEDALRERAAAAGAHFSIVAENIAVAKDAEQVHMGWMHSPGHRGNILDPNLTAIGIATVQARGYLFAAQDFSRVVESLSLEQQEQRIGALLQAGGFKVATGTPEARKTCAMESGHAGNAVVFYRFETADLSVLPEKLAARLKSIPARAATVGACTATEAAGFTRYRIGVLFF